MTGRLRIVAIIAAFNEADIIGQTVRHLIEQGIFVHLIDDGSTDCTGVVLAPFLASGLLSIERSVDSTTSGGSGVFRWASLVSRKEQLSRELEGDWFLHYDADESARAPGATSIYGTVSSSSTGGAHLAESKRDLPPDRSADARADVVERAQLEAFRRLKLVEHRRIRQAHASRSR